MTLKKLTRQDLLFHPTHGLCRVDSVTKQSRSGVTVPCYSLVPNVVSKMKVRFIIAAPDMDASGFHKVISAKEANKILEYLKAGDSKADQTNRTWALARNILSFSESKPKMYDQRKRQMLEYSVKGLLGEMACALKTSLKETAQRIQQNIGSSSRRSPSVLAAFAHAVED